MDELHRVEAEKIVGIVSRKYAAAWGVDVRDVAQQAWTIALEVHVVGNWSGGVRGFGTLVYVACMRQLSRYSRRQHCPVSLVDGDVKNSLEVIRNDAEKVALRDDADDACRTVIIEDLRQKLRARLYQLVGRTEATEAALLCWLDGESPAEAARCTGVAARDIYYVNDFVMGVSKADKQLRRLALELAQQRGWSVYEAQQG